MKRERLLRAALAGAALAGLGGDALAAHARPERLPWHGQGVWLQGDPHLHSFLLFSQGPGIVQAAADHKLHFIISAEHAERAFVAHVRNRLSTLRRVHPGLIILAGIEWNIPGAGHATLAVTPAPWELAWLQSFSQQFDLKVSRSADSMAAEGESDSEDGAAEGDVEPALAAFDWLRSEEESGGLKAVVYLNHPSKKEWPSDEVIARLQAAGLSGVEAGPGHQKWEHPGTDRTIDRYDPYVALIGGGYDQLLARGRYLGLMASSDFHTEESSYLPGQFSRTLVYAPERSGRGVIEGLRAGCTATVMGGVVSAVETRTERPGQTESVWISETLTVPVHARVEYRILLEVPEQDFEGQPNRLDRVEVISDFAGAPALVHSFESIGPGKVELRFSLPPEATAAPRRFYLRCRGRRVVGGPEHDRGNADTLFYTGATFVRVVKNT
ncbi:MAG TPA: hypothetical protein VGB99_01615 [Acidobacteriota bacterium]